jgi:hypothetical protein
MLRTRVLALTITLLVAPPVPGAAQERTWVPRPSPSLSLEAPAGDPFGPPQAAYHFSADSVPPTQWKKGALIGGAIGAVLGGLIGSAGCGLSDNPCDSFQSTVLGAAAGAALLAIPGALIGGAFPKEPEPSD